MLPLQHAIYKGTGGKFGAIQFNLQLPHFYHGKQKDYHGNFALSEGKLQPGWRQREGCIFLEITSAVDKNVYDWANKITMALSINDMGKVMQTLLYGEECKIMHDPGAQSETAGQVSKFLSISSPKGIKAGCMFTVSVKSGEQVTTHKVPLTGDECIVLRALIQAAIPTALNW